MVSARITSVLKEHGWILNLLFIALGAYFVAGAANAVVARSIRSMPSLDEAPRERRPAARGAAVKPPTELSAIAERNLLAALRENLTPVAVDASLAAVDLAGKPNENDLRPCTVPHPVRATLVADGAPEWSMVVVYNNTDREPNVYSINEGSNRIADDMVVVEIRDRAIVVRRRDHFELCQCEGDQAKDLTVASATPPPTEPVEAGAGVTMVSETQYTVERAEVDNALANLSEVATQARIVPSFKNGKPNGFKLFSIKPGSIYSKIGLKNGDVIHKINGYEMNSPDKALEIYQKLKDATSVSIELERRGQAKSMSYSIR